MSQTNVSQEGNPHSGEAGGTLGSRLCLNCNGQGVKLLVSEKLTPYLVWGLGEEGKGVEL